MNSSKRKSFDIVIITPNKSHEKTIELVLENSLLDHSIFLVDNGASENGHCFGEYSDLVKMSISGNPRVPEVYNRAWELTSTDFVCFLHNDTIILESGWDVKVEKYFSSDVGVLGFCGGTGFGDEKIYEHKFVNSDVARQGFLWNFKNTEVIEYMIGIGIDEEWAKKHVRSHGLNLDNELTKIVVVDGLAMIINREAFNRIGGFDERFVFQGFDVNFCLHAISLGYNNYAINIKYFHGGCGAGKSYFKLLEAHSVEDEELVSGTKRGVHHQACRILYDNWKDLLPIRVFNNCYCKRGTVI